jgi:membrane carboxypeptidase/penicillin-binding protein
MYTLIQANKGITTITQQNAQDFHSRLEQEQCRNRRLHEISYTLPTAAPAN